MARAASRDIYGAVGRKGEVLQLMRRGHLGYQWITGIEKMLWGAVGLRIPAYLRDLEEMLKTDRRVVLKLYG